MARGKLYKKLYKVLEEGGEGEGRWVIFDGLSSVLES